MNKYITVLLSLIFYTKIHAYEYIELIKKQSFGDNDAKVNVAEGVLGEVGEKKIYIKKIQDDKRAVFFHEEKIFDIPKSSIIESCVLKKETAVFHLMKDVGSGKNHLSLIVVTFGEETQISTLYIAGQSFYKGRRVRVFELLEIINEEKISCIIGIGEKNIDHYKAHLFFKEK